MILNGQIKLTHDFMASHEEADDRIMNNINQVFQRKDSETIPVVTSDTDITNVLKKRRIVSSKQQYELHRILLQLGRRVIFPQPID